MVIPRSLREEAGVREGALLKVAVVKGSHFLIIPQVTIDRPSIGSPKASRKQIFRELAAVVAEIRQEAKAKGVDKMTKREMNAAVASTRRALTPKNSKRPAK